MYEDDDPSIDSLEGYTRGEKVRVIEDNENEGYYAGDEGVIIGFHSYTQRFFGGPLEVIYVSFDYMDDEEGIEVDPYHLEPVSF